MSTIEIKHRFTTDVLFAHTEVHNSVAKTLREAVARGANLYGANLDGADLRGADLYGASLRGASLRGASLRGANLYGAHLRGADLDGEILTRNPVFVQGLEWPAIITEGYMRIGCQRHTHAAWKKFSTRRIGLMDNRAPELWAAWKDPLLAMCAAHAAKAAST